MLDMLSRVARIVVCSFLLGSAIDSGARAGQIFWIDNDTILRSDLEQPAAEVILTNDQGIDALGVDIVGARLYYGGYGGDLWSAKFNGSDEQLVIANAAPASIAIDSQGGKLYWTQAGSIHRADLDGSTAETIVTDTSAPVGIALDVANGWMYWGELLGVKRANLDGSDVILIAEQIAVVLDVAVDSEGGLVYWAAQGDIWRAFVGPTGGCCEHIIYDTAGPLQSPAKSIALDRNAEQVYWSRFTNDGPVLSGRIWHTDIEEPAAMLLLENMDLPQELFIDPTPTADDVPASSTLGLLVVAAILIGLGTARLRKTTSPCPRP